MKKFSTHPMFELPDGESYILNCHPNDMLKIHDMAEDIRLTKLCYINICSNSGLYKRPIYSKQTSLLSYLNADMIRHYFSMDVPRGSKEYTDLNRAIVIAPRHMMINAMHTNFMRGSDGFRDHTGRANIAPVIDVPIFDPDYGTDTINAMVLAGVRPDRHAHDILPSYGPRFTKMKPFYSGKYLHYHGRNKDYDWDEECIFGWAQILKDFIVAYTDKGDTILSTTGDLAILGIACLESRRFVVGCENDAQQFKLDSYIMKDYTKRYYSRGIKCLK